MIFKLLLAVSRLKKLHERTDRAGGAGEGVCSQIELFHHELLRTGSDVFYHEELAGRISDRLFNSHPIDGEPGIPDFGRDWYIYLC